jgi:hypothetical protein
MGQILRAVGFAIPNWGGVRRGATLEAGNRGGAGRGGLIPPQAEGLPLHDWKGYRRPCYNRGER